MIFFFFNDTATTEIYTLSLHDALPISRRGSQRRDTHSRRQPEAHARRHLLLPRAYPGQRRRGHTDQSSVALAAVERSEEHTSELQSRQYLVCRLLLEKKKKLQRYTR